LLKWIVFGKVTKVINYHEQIIFPQNLNHIFRRVGTKRNTCVYSVDQTYCYELLPVSKRQHGIRNCYRMGWMGQQPDNSDDIQKTLKLRSKQMLRAECVMDIKAIHIHRSGELFSKEE